MRPYALVTWTTVAMLLGMACSGKTVPGQPDPIVIASCSPQACQADLAAGRAALERGDFAAAAAAYACGDSREASFGAGLATFINALEGASASKMLADLGLPPLPAKDLFGATGIYSRYASRWHGNGMIQMSGAQGDVRSHTFERGQQLTGNDPYIRMRSTTSIESLSLLLGSTPRVSGTTIALGCQTAGFIPSMSLSLDGMYCYTPGVCAADAGSIAVVSAGTAAGDKSEYRLQGVKVMCRASVAGTAPSANPMETPYFVDGTLTTTLAGPVDLSDLHPLMSDDEPFSAVPATTTLGQVVADARGLRDTLDVCSCYFKAAAAGPAGRVFEVPSTLFGGAPIPVTAADAKLLAATTETGAGALQLLAAYDLPMALSGLLCGGSIACLSDREATDRFNAGLGRLVIPEAFAPALSRFLDASEMGAVALGELSSESIILRTPDTAASLDRGRDYLQWAHDSMLGSNPEIPHVTPSLKIDLAAPFTHPPDPSVIPSKPFSYDPTNGQVKVVEAFLQAAFPAWSNLQWNGAFWDQFDVASTPGPDRSDLIGRRLEAYGIAGN